MVSRPIRLVWEWEFQLINGIVMFFEQFSFRRGRLLHTKLVQDKCTEGITAAGLEIAHAFVLDDHRRQPKMASGSSTL